MMRTLRPVSMLRIRALAALRVRRLWRTRVIILAALLALLPLLAAAPRTPRAALALLASALLTAVLVCTAGAVADDLESGAALLLALHDARPLERVVAEATATLAVIAGLALLAGAMVADQLASVHWRTLVAAGSWIAALVLSWTLLVVFLGCLLPGKGNALVMIIPLAAFAVPSSALPLGGTPEWLASAIRALWNLLPLQAHVTALLEALVAGAPLPTTPSRVLLVSPPFYLAVAACTLARVEPARRFSQ